MPDIPPSEPPVSETPAPEPSFSEPAVTSSPEPVTSSPSPSPATQPGRKRGGKLKLVIGLLLILAVAAGAIAYSTKPAAKPPAAVKRDIPYLTYGIDSSGDLTIRYPLETVDTAATDFVDAQLFEGLVRYKDQTKIIPLLATNWSNPDNSTWVFNLRHGVSFHSGRTMTAADVKYSLDYAIAHQSDNDSSTLALASTIAQVTVVNPYQVKITTNGPDPVLLNRLAYLPIIDSKGKLGDPNNGSGPYMIKPGTTPSATALDIVAINHYWGGHIYTRAVHLQSSTNSDQIVTDTAAGKYDIAGDFSSQRLAKIKNYHPITVTDLGVSFLGLNTVKAGTPLQSLAGRQAVSYALNIPAILKAGGLQGVPVSQLIPPAIPGYDSSISNTAYNPAKAKQLLASVKNAAVPITLSYPAGDEGQLTEISKELTAVGFNVKLSSIQSLGDLVDLALAGKTDMFYLTYTSNTLDGLDIIESTVAGNANYSSSELDSLTKQASSTIDPAARIAILQKVEQLVHTDVPAVPLYTLTRTYALTKPYSLSVDIPSAQTGTYFWQVYQH